MGWGLAGSVGGALLAVVGGVLVMGARHGRHLACPACGGRLRFGSGEGLDDRIVTCSECASYLRLGADGLAVMPERYVAPVPTFEAPLPSGGVTWPEGCALCGTMPTEVEVICLGGADTLRVPVCQHHRDQAVVTLRPRERKLRFRSHAASVRFRDMNAAGPFSTTDSA